MRDRSGHLASHRAPEKAGKLTADRGDCHLGAFATKDKAHVLATESSAGTVGIAEDQWIHPVASLEEGAAAGMIAAVVPGGFHQQSSQMAVACLGDASLATFVSAGTF